MITVIRLTFRLQRLQGIGLAGGAVVVVPPTVKPPWSAMVRGPAVSGSEPDPQADIVAAVTSITAKERVRERLSFKIAALSSRRVLASTFGSP